jgi:trk system potassium uptake protein TrkA
LLRYKNAAFNTKRVAMKIIILGAGQVGGTLAENLVDENNDITVVDTDTDRLRQLQDKFDLRVVNGHGSHPRVLREAGAEDADMLVAVTNSDETNMVACQVAYSLFNTPNKVARIRSSEYIRESDRLFQPDDIPIDYLISPEQLVIDYIYKLIQYPGALQVVNFAEGRVSIVAVKAYYGGSLVGNALSSLREHMPHIDSKVAAIFRQDRPIKPQGSTVIEAGDEVFFVAASQHIRAVMSELQRLEKPYKRIMIAGGGNVGAGLALRLEKDYSIKLIEHNQERATELAELLHDTIVFYGDASDQELLAEEHIEQVDVFIALTNDDEANIMSAMLAKRMGAKKAMVLIQRDAYVDLVQGGVIDIAISPQQATVSALLGHVRKADIVSVFSLRRGVAEAIEAVAHGDEHTSKVVGRKIGDIKLPPGTTIGAIVRGEEVIIANDYSIIQQDDHVIMFITDKKFVPEVEKLFQPSPFFL